MSLKILYGSSLTDIENGIYGKVMREADENRDKDYIILVPEQGSLFAQKEALLSSDRKSLFNVDVLTFQRLAHRIFTELNEDTKEILDDTGKQMLLRLIIDRKKDELTVLRRNVGKEGFPEELKSIISELCQYGISPENLKQTLENLSDYPYLKSKLSDLSIIYGDFLELLHEKYEIAEEMLTHLAKCMEKWEPKRKVNFILNGFTGFTPPQKQVLAVLMKKAESVSVFATLGQGMTTEEKIPADSLFSMSATLISNLKEAAIENGIQIEDDFGITEEKTVSPEIRHIERNFNVYPKQKNEENQDNVKIFRCTDIQSEVNNVVGEIRKCIREGLRYRDIGITVGNPDDYRDEIRTKFLEAEIPFFIDREDPLSDNVLFNLIKTVLRLITYDFSFDDVADYIKNPLTVAYFFKKLREENDGNLPFNSHERIFELENYVRSIGIRNESRYKKEWKKRKDPENLTVKRINETKDIVLIPVFSLSKKNKECIKKEEKLNVRQRLFALCGYLEEIGAYFTLTKKAEKIKEDNQVLSREYEKCYELLITLFDKTESILGDSVLTDEEFNSVLGSGIDSLGLGSVPPSLDRLVIGDLKRTRHGNIKRLFVLGASEGALPDIKSGGSLISEPDREILKKLKVELSPGPKEDSLNALFYLYLLFTKPTEKLILSYPLKDREGKSRTPAHALSEIVSMFGDSIIENRSEDCILLSTPEQGISALSSSLRMAKGRPDRLKDSESGLYKWLSENEKYGQALETVLTGAKYKYVPEQLPGNVAKELYTESITGSVSMLEKYAGCAFAHFLRYGLLLKPRKEYEVENADIGTVLHDSLDVFTKKMNDSGKTFSELTAEECTELAGISVEEVIEKEANDIFRDGARNQNRIDRVKRIIERTVTTLKTQWDAGDYRFIKSEVDFTSENAGDELTLSLDNGQIMKIQGRIDRIDYVNKDGKLYFKIIDYKSGDTSPDFTKLYNGRQLQLLLYQKAAMKTFEKDTEAENIVPAGVYYYHIDDPIVEGEKAGSEKADSEKAILKKLMLKGITNSSSECIGLIDRGVTDPGTKSTVVKSLERKTDGDFKSESIVLSDEKMKLLSDFAYDKAKELADKMTSGFIPVNPIKISKDKPTCEYCDYRGICGFDESIDGFKMSNRRKKQANEIIEEERNKHAELD